MRLTLLLLTIFGSTNAFACSEVLMAYKEECRAQDRYQRLTKEYGALSINMTELKGFKIPKALGKVNYYSQKNEVLNQTEVALPKNRNWQVWSNGQKFIEHLHPVYLQFSDITKLHKSMYAEKTFFSSSPDLGKLRTSNSQTNPKITLTCADKLLNDKLFELLSDYDLKSAEGYPLLTLENINVCDDKNISSGDVFFYKGASVKTELTRWLMDLNDMVARYENGSASSDLAPYSYLSDMRRWFLAIKPFTMGNEEVVAALIDYVAKRLQLAPMSQGDINAPIYLSVYENRNSDLTKIQETLAFFESCLFETKTKLVSSECSALK